MTNTQTAIRIEIRRNACANVIGMTLTTPKGTEELADRTYWAGSYLGLHLAPSSDGAVR